MLKWLVPSSPDFFNLFQQHAAVTHNAAVTLHHWLLGSSHDNGAAAQIRALEHDADLIAHNCIEELHKTFITPFPRDQIHLLISRLDDIIDAIEEAAACLYLYKVDTFTEEARQQSSILVAITKEVIHAVEGLRHLKNTTSLQQTFQQINYLENEGDNVVRAAIGHLFESEKESIQIIKWKEIYEQLEEAIDSCEDVANIIEGVILESV